MIVTGFSVTLPVLVTVKVYDTESPADCLPSPLSSLTIPAPLSKASAGLSGMGVDVLELAVMAAPDGGYAATPAVLLTDPESMSLCVSA